MHKIGTNHIIDNIFIITLFCIFSVTVLACAISGSTIYKRIASADSERYNERTSLEYIQTKLRHYDDSGMIYLTDFCGANAVAMDETDDGIVYTTIIYYHDGYIRELFTEKNSDFSAEDGVEIIPAKNLYFTMENDSLIHIVLQTESDTVSQIYYSLKSE